jgi:hypothetical protein
MPQWCFPELRLKSMKSRCLIEQQNIFVPQALRSKSLKPAQMENIDV